MLTYNIRILTSTRQYITSRSACSSGGTTYYVQGYYRPHTVAMTLWVLLAEGDVLN